MSGLIHLYLIDEAVFPKTLTGSSQQKYQQLIDITLSNGIRWQTVELNMRGFIPAISMWDKVAGNSQLIEACSFHYLPNHLIAPDAEINGSFGFFPSEMITDLSDVMEENLDFDINSYDGKQLVKYVEQNEGDLDPDAYEIVRNAYYRTFRDAKEQDKSIVILMEEL